MTPTKQEMTDRIRAFEPELRDMSADELAELAALALRQRAELEATGSADDFYRERFDAMRVGSLEEMRRRHSQPPTTGPAGVTWGDVRQHQQAERQRQQGQPS